MVNTSIRISSALVEQPIHHRVWRVDVPREILRTLDPQDHHVRLVNDQGRLVVQFGTHGAKLDEHGSDSWVSANSVSDRHLEGMGGAAEDLDLTTMLGRMDRTTKSVMILNQLPRVVSSAMVDMEELREQASPEAHFPARHFPEDITDREIK